MACALADGVQEAGQFLRLMEAEEIRRLQERVAALEDLVKRERHKAELSEQQLELFLQQHAQQQQQVPQHHSSPLDDRPSEAASACGASSSSYMGRRVASQSTHGAARLHEDEESDMVLISRKEYDLLLLKDKAISVLQEGITIADCSLPDMPLIFANAGFAKITGYSVKHTIDKNCRFLQGEGTDQATLQELRDAITQGRSCVVQLMNYRKNGDPFVNYLSVTPIRNAAGKVTHYVGIQSDITELVNHRKAELAAKHAALQAAAATEAKSEFLARMSHEIRTPLNGMIAVGQLLAETSLSPAQWDLVNTIRCSGETLLVLITDILDFSRIEANKMVLNHSVFKLETVMEAAMEIAGLRAAQKRLQVAYHIADNTPRVLLGDAQRLQQILLNILNNAVKFTEDGQVLLEVWVDDVEEPESELEPELWRPMQPARAGQVVTAPASGSASRVSMHTLKGHEGAQSRNAAVTAAGPKFTLHFSVRDTGIGISANDLGRLFSSFTQVDTSPTRRYGGSGLGLAISKKLCMCMEGDMWVDSPGLGSGTTFSWTIKVRVPSVDTTGQRRPKLRRRSALYPSTTARLAQLPELPVHPGAGSQPLQLAAAALDAPIFRATSPRKPAAERRRQEQQEQQQQQQQQHRQHRRQHEEQSDTQWLPWQAPMPAVAAAQDGTEAMLGDSEPGAAHASHSNPTCSCIEGVCAAAEVDASRHLTHTQAGGGSTHVSGQPGLLDAHGQPLPLEALQAAELVAQPSSDAHGHGTLQDGPSRWGSERGGAAGSHEVQAQEGEGSESRASEGQGRAAGQSNSSHSGSGAVDAAGAALQDGMHAGGLHHRNGQQGIGATASSSKTARAGGHGLGRRVLGSGTRKPPVPSRSFSGCGMGETWRPRMLSPAMPPILPFASSDNRNPLLQGKKVLLVEPCNMIRQVLMLALHSWGCHVCAVPSQHSALQQFVDAGTLSHEAANDILGWTSDDAASAPTSASSLPPHHQPNHHQGTQTWHQPLGGPGALPQVEPPTVKSRRGGLTASVSTSSLSHSGGAAAAKELPLRCAASISESRFRCKGPYDIVIMDMSFTRVLRAITECSPEEVQRLVFLGWPGQSELESTDAEEWRSMQELDLPDPVKSVTDKPGSRQLGYVIVTRPVKQGRLALALEEVLAMQLHDEPQAASSASLTPSPDEQGGGGTSHASRGMSEVDLPAAASAAASACAAGWDALAAGVPEAAPSGSPVGSAGGAGITSDMRSRLTRSLLAHTAVGGGGSAADSPNFCGSSSTSSRLLSLGGDEGMSNSGCPTVSNGQLSLGNSTLRPATVKKSASHNELCEPSTSHAAAPLRILLAEDNAINMKVALGILKRIGHSDVVTVENGEEALAAVEAVGGGNGFHLVLMDLHMPIMGGMEAVRELKKRYPDMRARVVAVTADAFEVTRDDCMAAGFDGWLPKPFRVEDMVRIVNDTSANFAGHA